MLKVFDRNLIPIGVLPDADQVQRKRRLNSDYELSFLLPMSSDDYTEKITLKGHVQDERGQYYVINSRKRVRDGLKRTVQIDCMHVMFKLTDIKMPYNSYIEEGYGVDILTLTNLITDATKGKFKFIVDDVFDLKDIKDFGRGNALQALNSVIKEYDAEVDPDNFFIHLKKKIGVDAGLQYRFKKNIISNSFQDDSRALVTRMFATMKDTRTFIGLDASNLTQQEYDLLNTIPGAIADGKIQVNYLISPYAAGWSNDTNEYYDGEFEDQNIEDPLELLKATRKALEEQEIPSLDVTISAADLYKIDGSETRPGLGDTAYLIDPDLEMNNITARVVELTEYPFSKDRHSTITLANYMLKDYADIIADLDRSKRIVDDLISGGRVRASAFEAFAEQAVRDIQNSKSEVIYDQRGIALEDKTNRSNQVILTSNGILITEDGGATAKVAMTGNGIAAEYITGILGEFVQLRANQIIVGPSGELIGDELLGSANKWNGRTTLLTGNGVYTGELKANQIVVGDNGALIGDDLLSSGSVWNKKTTLINETGVYTGQVTTNQLVAGSAKISAALIEDLVVGGNVEMGPDAHISWGKVDNIPGDVYNPSYIRSTYIDSTRIESPNIVGGIITGGSIVSNSTIDVTTDANIGRTLNLKGSGGSGDDAIINFLARATIAASSSYLGLSITTFQQAGVTIDGRKIATQYWVENQANITAKFG